MPLKIYLDSNDYSRFAQLDKQSDAIKESYDAVTNWVEEGLIEVRYSSVNVFEAAPLSKEVVPLALGRLNAIYKICAKKCMIDITRLLLTEATNAASVEVLNDRGDWHPVVFDLDIPDAAKTARALLDHAKGAATSRQMKVFENQYFDRHGRLRDEARPKIVAFRKGIGAQPFAGLPMSPKALDSYYAFLLGRIKRDQLMNAFIESFSDLNRWGEWYSSAWEAADGLTRNLRAPAEKLADEIRRLAAMLRIMYANLKSSGMHAKEIQRIFDERANPDAMRSGLLAALANGIKSPRSRDGFSWSETPAFEAYSTVAMQVVRDSAMRVTMPRQTLDSDFVDCLHVCYSPFVDIFRADAYMVNVLERCKLPLKTRFVAKLEDLPSVIESHPSFGMVDS